MGQLLIRNIPDEVIETYKLKARLKGMSVERYLRDMIEAGSPLTPAERVALIDENMSQFATALPSQTLEEIREGLM